ncbi:hypothetical protein OG223_19395 [Streptomyces sp. NBC_01478]|uniref:hypothetical protein n=1 Tax=Streptomyces sp. NBC_01478 TaxID=2903882 RepID=UPI002E3508F7|nr:hypothetical protein [Streptomyces sp. NBC_01478]
MTEARIEHGVGWSPGPGAYTAAGIGTLALAAWAAWSDLLLVVWGRVVPGWGVSGTVLVLALVLWRTFLRAARREETARLAWKRTRWLWPTSAVLIAVAASGSAWGALDDLVSDARYYVLSPTGPGGCRAVVRETSFLVIGNGEAYAVGRTGLALGEADSWVVDDGYRPVAAGTYELKWDRSGGLLLINGTNVNPVVRGGQADIDCGW